MRKIGRNEPCPCGSGKKYKKCCLKNDQEGRIRAARGPDLGGEWFEDDIQTDYEDSPELDWDEDQDEDEDELEPEIEESNFDQEESEPFVSKTISDDIPEISEQEQTIVDEWWQHYKEIAPNAGNVKQHLEHFFEAHPKLVQNLELHDGVLFELGAQMTRDGNSAEYVAFMERIRSEFADSYVKSHVYYDRDIIFYKVATGKKDEVPAFLNYFKEYPDHDADILFNLIRFLMATDCGEILTDLLADIYYPVCVSPKIMRGQEILNPLLVSYYGPYLENGYSDDDLLELVDRIKQLRISLVDHLYQPEFFKSFFDRILAEPTEWSIADCATNKDIYQRYKDISLNFMGYLRKERGMGWVKAEFFRELVNSYLVAIIPEGKRPKKAFIFTRDLIEQIIGQRCRALFSLDCTNTLSLLRALFWFAEFLNKSGNVSDEHKIEIQTWCSEINNEVFPSMAQNTIAAMAFEGFPE
jgi:hypothetical protein